MPTEGADHAQDHDATTGNTRFHSQHAGDSSARRRRGRRSPRPSASPRTTPPRSICKALAKKGLITLEPGSARGIRLVEQLGLPLIGSVAAGSPILAVENVQRRYTLDAGLFSRVPISSCACAACR
jgi:hypothetical protein